MLDQAKLRLPAHHRERLQQLLMLCRQPVDARGKYALYCRRQTQLRERARHLHCAVAHQRALVEQGLHHLLDEERIAPGTLDHQTLEWHEFDPVTQKREEHLAGAFPANASSRNCE